MNILERIKRGDTELPPRILLSGPIGIGKSKFASNAPNPVFICPEDGLMGLEHLPRMVPTNLEDLTQLLQSLLAESQGFKTVVIDTCDWMERLIFSSVCKRDSKANIEDYGYGKGYPIAEQELVAVLALLDQIRAKHKMYIVLLSHVQIKPFTDPQGVQYDRYELKGHKRMTGILLEWPDACLFAIFEVHKTKMKGSMNEKAIAGDRVIHTQWSPGWDAKNRLNLPETLEMTIDGAWDNFVKEVQANSTSTLRATVRTLFTTAKLDDASKLKWDPFIARVDALAPEKVKDAIKKLQSKQ